MADGKVIIDTALDNKGFTRGINNMKGELGGLTSTVKKLGAVIGVAFGVGALVNFGKAAVELGSNIAEVQNVVDVAFGDMSYKIEEFAKTSIQSFGMSKLAAKKTASTYMAMARGMGMGEESASDMAIALTGLSGDVASFFNISQELADVKLKSVFTGETETLKDLGVVMTQTNLKAYALSKGIGKDIEKMTQAELVSLRYKFVMDQLALAHGDFARTSDSWANQTRILSEQWKEFMSIVGQALITVLTPMVQTLNSIVSALIDAANAVNSVITALFGGASAQMQQTQQAAAGVDGAIEGSVEDQNDLTDAVKETNKEEKKGTAIFDELNKIVGNNAASASQEKPEEQRGEGNALVTPEQVDGAESRILKLLDTIRQWASEIKGIFSTLWDSLSDNFMLAQEKIRMALSGFAPMFSKMWEDIAALGSPLLGWFNTDFTQFLQTLIDVWGDIFSGLLETFQTVLSDVWSLVIAPSLQKWATDILPFWTQVATQLVSTMGVLFNEVKRIFDMIWADAVRPALVLIQQIWSDTWDSIIQAWHTWGEPIFDKIRTAIRETADTLVNIWQTVLKPVWDIILETISTLWENHLRPLLDNVLNFIGTLVDGALRIYNEFILPVVNWLVDMFGPAFVAAFQIAADGFEAVFGGIIDAISGIVTALTGVVELITGVFTGDWELAWKGLGDIVTGVFNGVADLLAGIINRLIIIVEGFVNFFISGINSIISALNTISFDVPDWVPLIGGKNFGVDIPNVPKMNIPRLAQGAVIPANREFLAVLGDQKSGTNIEAPLSTLEEALGNVLDQRGGGAQEIAVTVRFEGSMAQFARMMKPHIDAEGKRTGVKLVGVTY